MQLEPMLICAVAASIPFVEASPLSSVAGGCLVQGYNPPESVVHSRQRGWGQHIPEGDCVTAQTPKGE